MYGTLVEVKDWQKLILKMFLLTITQEFKMKKINTKKTAVVAAILFIAGIVATQAFGFMGGGNHMGGNSSGYGNHMGYGMMGNGYMMGNLSVEDQQKMLDQMNTFFASTKDIREQLYQKQVELNAESAKPEKDQAKIETLEKDLFDLSSRFEKQRFDHMLTVRKLFPDDDNGSFRGMGGRNGNCF